MFLLYRKVRPIEQRHKSFESKTICSKEQIKDQRGREKEGIRTMKKKIITLGMVAALVATTTACGNKYVDLGEYKGLNIEYAADETEITDEVVEQNIASQLSSISQEVTDKNYKAKEGDTVNIDYKGLKDGKAFDGGTAQGYDLVLGSNSFIDGFEDGLIGAKKGQKLSLNLTFPEEYQSDELAGQDVVFKVTVNEIKQAATIEDLDDEFVTSNFPDYKTVEEYKNSVKEDMINSQNETVEEAKKDAAWEEVVANCKIKDYPQEDIDQYIEDSNKYVEEMLSHYGDDLTIDDYLEQMGQSKEDYEEQQLEAAKKEVASCLVAEAIAKKEKLELTEDEYDEMLTEYTNKFQYDSTDALEEEAGKETLTNEFQRVKVIDFIVENCTFTHADGMEATDTQE